MLRETPPARRRAVIAIAEAIDTGSKADLGAIVREAQIAELPSTRSAFPRSRLDGVGQRNKVWRPPLHLQEYLCYQRSRAVCTRPDLEELRRGNMDLGALGEHTLNFSAPPIGGAARATGGLYQSTFTDDSIERAIDRIAEELTAQYTLSYRPSSNQVKGDFHKIKVVVVNKGKLKVRSRPGYYVSHGR
jgi:hypothetical protein